MPLTSNTVDKFNFISSTNLPVTLTTTATTLNILGVMWMKEELHRFSALHDTVTPSVRYIIRGPRLSGRVYVPIAAIYDAVRTTVLVMELTVRTHFVAKLVSTCAGTEPGLAFW
jgi:hypothetical protein